MQVSERGVDGSGGRGEVSNIDSGQEGGRIRGCFSVRSISMGGGEKKGRTGAEPGYEGGNEDDKNPLALREWV